MVWKYTYGSDFIIKLFIFLFFNLWTQAIFGISYTLSMVQTWEDVSPAVT